MVKPPGMVAAHGRWCPFPAPLLLIVIAMAGTAVLRAPGGSPRLGDPHLLHVPGSAGPSGSRLGSCQCGDTVRGLVNGLLNSRLSGIVLGMLCSVSPASAGSEPDGSHAAGSLTTGQPAASSNRRCPLGPCSPDTQTPTGLFTRAGNQQTERSPNVSLPIAR
jgi:hypothetical protein